MNEDPSGATIVYMLVAFAILLGALLWWLL
jgi:hypothetical protein